MKKKSTVWLLVGCGIVGFLLLLFGGSFSSLTAQTENQTQTPAALDAAEEMLLYKERLEREIKSICEAVKGVSDVQVAVTLAGGYTSVYAQDANGDYISIGSGTSRLPVLLRIQPPTLAGIGIVCRGGDNLEVQNQLLALIGATYGLSPSKICVTGK